MTIPSQNTGMETPIMAPVVKETSSHEFRFNAAMMPQGNPMMKAQSTEPAKSSRVMGSLCMNMGRTCSPVAMDTPQSP